MSSEKRRRPSVEHHVGDEFGCALPAVGGLRVFFCSLAPASALHFWDVLMISFDLFAATKANCHEDGETDLSKRIIRPNEHSYCPSLTALFASHAFRSRAQTLLPTKKTEGVAHTHTQYLWMVFYVLVLLAGWGNVSNKGFAILIRTFL